MALPSQGGTKSIVMVGETKVTRSRVLVFTGVLVATLVAGLLTGIVGGVPEALAACGAPNPCPGGDLSRTSVLSVYQVYDPEYTNLAVEPNTTDYWDITPVWATAYDDPSPCDCVETTFPVSVAVSWSDANHAWSVSCTGCNALYGPVYSVGVCLEGSYCGSPTVDNSTGYKLYADVEETYLYYCAGYGYVPAYLVRVEYDSTAVDDGNLVNLQACTEGSSVSPISQSWSQTDYGPLECTYDCSQSGPSVTIEYE